MVQAQVNRPAHAEAEERGNTLSATIQNSGMASKWGGQERGDGGAEKC